MRPPAPGRSSTTNATPRAALSLSATMRVSRSAVPAAENGTMIFTGRAGQVWACTNVESNPATMHAIGNKATRVIILRKMLTFAGLRGVAKIGCDIATIGSQWKTAALILAVGAWHRVGQFA